MTLPPRLVIASHNAGKVAEIADLLKPLAIRVTGADELGLEEPEETGGTFEANAVLKAVAAMRSTGLPALGDDSGLAVDALEGAPGICSARWAGPDRDFAAAIARLERELAGLEESVSELPLCPGTSHGQTRATRTFHGRVEGTLTFPPRGCSGFGYDPAFVPAGDVRTYAEMSMTEKMATNHRARAFKALVAALT